MGDMVQHISNQNAVKAFVISALEVMPIRPPHPPGSPEYRGLVAMIISALEGFSPAVLEAGMKTFVVEWDKRSWPLPADLRTLMRGTRNVVEPVEREKPKSVEFEGNQDETVKGRVADGMARIREGLRLGYDKLLDPDVPNDGQVRPLHETPEWADWCRHGVLPDRIRGQPDIKAEEIPF